MASQYPTALDSAADLLVAANQKQSALSAGITAASTSLTVASTSGWPDSGIVSCQNEIIYYGAKSGNSLIQLERGFEGTTAAAHAQGQFVRMVITAQYHNEIVKAVRELQRKIGHGASYPAAGQIAVGQADGSTRYYDPEVGIPSATISEGSDANAVKLNVALDTQEMEGALAAKHYDKGGAFFHVKAPEYGGKADALQISGAMSSSSNTHRFTATTSVFTSDDVNKVIYVVGAGTSGAMLKTTIASYTSPTVVELTGVCATTVSGATAYFGTDNTTAFENAQDAVLAAGNAGVIELGAGDYIITRFERERGVCLQGAGEHATTIMSAVADGAILSTEYPINGSNYAENRSFGFTVKGLDPDNKAAGYVDVCGTYVEVTHICFKDTFYGAIFDQTEVSDLHHCRFETQSVAYYGAIIGTTDPTSGSYWTKTGSFSPSSDGSRWAISITSGQAYYSRALSSTAFKRGFTILFRGLEVVSGTQTLRICNGTQRFDLTFTGSTVALNGGTGRAILQGHYGRLEVAEGGATATLKVNGSTTDTSVAALSATTLNTCVAFGQLTSGTSAVYWNDFWYQSSHPLPAGLWLVSGDDWTPSASAEFTNVITISNNQFNTRAIQIAMDGGYCQFIENNNFNDGLYSIAVGASFASVLKNNTFESAQWEAVRIGGVKLQSSTPIGSPKAITIQGGQAQHGSQTGFPAFDFKQGGTIRLDGVNFPSGSSTVPAVRYNGTEVNYITQAGCDTGGCNIFAGVPNSDSTRIVSDKILTASGTAEAHVYKQSSHKFRTVRQTLTANGATALDLSLGSDWVITLTANSTITISNIDKVSDVRMLFVQGGSGSYTPTLSAAPKWIGGAAPTWSTTVGRSDYLEFWSNGTALIEKNARNLNIS